MGTYTVKKWMITRLTDEWVFWILQGCVTSRMGLSFSAPETESHVYFSGGCVVPEKNSWKNILQSLPINHFESLTSKLTYSKVLSGPKSISGHIRIHQDLTWFTHQILITWTLFAIRPGMHFSSQNTHCRTICKYEMSNFNSQSFNVFMTSMDYQSR